MQSLFRLQDLAAADTLTVEQIIVATHANDLGGKVWNPLVRWNVKYAVFILIVDNNGLTGVGECWCFDTVPDSLVSYLRTEVCPPLINQNLRQVLDTLNGLQQRATLTARHGMLATSISGIDAALWDIVAQRQKVPLWQAFNPAGSGDFKTYCSGGLYGQDKTTADLVAEMCAMTSHGYDIVKMKIGALALREDIDRVNEVLRALPPDCKLIIDGVYAYTRAEVLEIYSAIDSSRIEAFQSPLVAHDIDGMRLLTEQGIPVMAVEAEYRREIHSLMIQTRAVRFLQLAPVACGGPSRVLELANDVESTDITLSLEVSSTAIARMIAAQLAGASAQIAHTESHSVHTVFDERLSLKNDAHQSRWQLPDCAGLGISLLLDDDRVSTAFVLAN